MKALILKVIKASQISMSRFRIYGIMINSHRWNGILTS